jgi:hypothetical protein
MKTKKAAEFKKDDRVQIKAEVLKERGYAPSDEVGIIVEGPYKNPQCGPNTYTVNWPKDGMKLSDASELKAAPAPRPAFRTHVLHKDDFTNYAREIGVWQGLCEDHGISPDADEIEITVTAAKKVA